MGRKIKTRLMSESLRLKKDRLPVPKIFVCLFIGMTELFVKRKLHCL